MSYEKAMKWNRKHPKGISYKRGYMGFNASGVTTEYLDTRERDFVAQMKEKTLTERKEYWATVSECIALRLGSWEWEWCAFKRNFIFQNEVH